MRSFVICYLSYLLELWQNLGKINSEQSEERNSSTINIETNINLYTTIVEIFTLVTIIKKSQFYISIVKQYIPSMGKIGLVQNFFTSLS